MKTLSPRSKDPKDVTKLPLSRTIKNRTLAHSVARTWGSKIPRRARAAIWPLVLSSVSSCLSSELPHGLDDAIQEMSSKQDLKGYIDLKARYGLPQKYEGPRSYFATQVVLNLFSKTRQTVPGLDPTATAFNRFKQAETFCSITNRRLLHYRRFDHSGRPLIERLAVHEIFHLARRKIQQWLGPLDAESVLDGCRHGPGGVVGLKRPFTTPYFKLANSRMSCSAGAYWYAVRSLASNDVWIRAIAQSEGLCGWDHDFSCVPFETRLRLADKCITIADANEVTFVDKDAKTKRSISIEPQLNVYLQLSVGSFLKRKLRAVGCDLSDQSRNQGLAHIGSLGQDRFDPVTLDLSMASDCLSVELVRELLPSDWFEFLDNLRSRYGSYRGEAHEWNKFSSMGNGFTFELESMIFYALAQACSDYTGTTYWFSDTFGPAYKYAYVSVFGDDIIVPAVVSDHLTQILRYCGFRLNSEKSFVDGPFRESCGCDYWNGMDVRTFYFKRDLSGTRDLIHLHNGLKVMSNKLGGQVLQPTLDLIRRMIPTVVERHLRGGEPTYDDSYVWCEPDEVMSSGLVYWNIHWQRWCTPSVRSADRPGKGTSHWRYAQFLYINTSVGFLSAARESSDSIGAFDNRIPDPSFGGDGGSVKLSGEGKSTYGWM